MRRDPHNYWLRRVVAAYRFRGKCCRIAHIVCPPDILPSNNLKGPPFSGVTVATADLRPFRSSFGAVEHIGADVVEPRARATP